MISKRRRHEFLSIPAFWQSYYLPQFHTLMPRCDVRICLKSNHQMNIVKMMRPILWKFFGILENLLAITIQASPYPHVTPSELIVYLAGLIRELVVAVAMAIPYGFRSPASLGTHSVR